MYKIIKMSWLYPRIIDTHYIFLKAISHLISIQRTQPFSSSLLKHLVLSILPLSLIVISWFETLVIKTNLFIECPDN